MSDWMSVCFNEMYLDMARDIISGINRSAVENEDLRRYRIKDSDGNVIGDGLLSVDEYLDIKTAVVDEIRKRLIYG